MSAGSRPQPTAGRHLALVGPTASGKSAVALALAEARTAAGSPTEIVSCDSMQVYRGMDVGTAKPTAAERERVPHHMVDVADPRRGHDLPRFLAGVAEALAGIDARGACALLVGGTGLYVRGVVDQLEPPPRYPDVAAELEALDTDELAARLAAADPEALAQIPPGNRRRLVRALEVTIGSGRPFSSHGPGLDAYPPTPWVLAGLWPTREVLTARIAARYDAQMSAGMLQEVHALAALGDDLSREAAQALGYRELLAHLSGECSLDDALAAARVRTRRFAVRQQRWFARDPRIAWFDPPGTPGRGPEVVATEVDALWRKRAASGTCSVATVDGPARNESE